MNEDDEYVKTVHYWEQGQVGTVLQTEVRRGRKGGERRGNFPLASVGSWAVGDNRKKARSTQRRVGPQS